jgi:hypothetical protein
LIERPGREGKWNPTKSSKTSKSTWSCVCISSRCYYRLLKTWSRFLRSFQDLLHCKGLRLSLFCWDTTT